jgi:precorrin-6Y C5,15-methyltransferase (decarboxylating)
VPDAPPPRPWLRVVGIDEAGRLAAGGEAALSDVDTVFGATRHLERAPLPSPAERQPWHSPFADSLAALLGRRGQPTGVLATGDPGWHGVGATLLDHLPADEVLILPAPSAFQMAAARQGWAMQSVTPLSLHGRPVESLTRYLQPGRRLIVLTSDRESAPAIARTLCLQGAAGAWMAGFARMGAPDEQHFAARADQWPDPSVLPAPITLTIDIDVMAGPGLQALTPGLADDAFDHDGQITKREVRAAALARLAPMPAATLWDVGAGSGAIGIEWLRAGGGAAYAIEADGDRCRRIAANASALGAPELTVVSGAAPRAFTDLPAPDAVFVGGGVGRDGLLESAWSALPPGGRLVAHAITLDGEGALLALHRRLGGDLTRIAVQKAEPIGRTTAWRALAPVTQIALAKP